jgi:hydrogenase/urease accessory protein HupE
MLVEWTFFKRMVLSVIILLLAMVACAYCDVTHLIMTDLTSGFSHPLEGLDHVITMLGVGIWAAQLRGKAVWLLPVTFVTVMSLGGISGAASYLAIPSAEVLIIASCLVFSALIIRKIHFGTKINVLIVAFFAFFHGYAHGQEISTSASLVSYTVGFMLATMLLHGTGILVAKVILLSAAFLISQTQNITPSEAVSIESQKSYHSMLTTKESANYQLATQKPPLIIDANRWLMLTPHAAVIGYFFISIKYYLSHCLLLCVFYISQFFCYIFYPKQHGVFVLYSKLPLCFFKKSFYLLTPRAFNSSKYLFTPFAFIKKAGWCASKFFTFISNGIIEK